MFVVFYEFILFCIVESVNQLQIYGFEGKRETEVVHCCLTLLDNPGLP